MNAPRAGVDRTQLVAAMGPAGLVLLVGLVAAGAGIAALRRHEAMAGAESRLADARALIAQQEEHAARLAQALDEHRRMVAPRVSDPSVARMIEAISTQAKRQRLQVSIVQPQAEQAYESLAFTPGVRVHEVPLQLKLKGRYRHIGEFLDRLMQAPMLALVRRVHLTHPDAGPQLQADIELLVYIPDQERRG
jgi:hypothetical protein